MSAPTRVDLAAPLRAAGAVGWVHAVDIDTGREVGLEPDRRVAVSSVVKLPLLVAFFRQADAGRLDPARPCAVPVAGRTAGITGVSLFADAATISLRDLALLMITISDNAAADLVFDAVGVAEVQAEMRAIGLSGIAVRESLHEMFDALRDDSGGVGPLDASARLADPELRSQLRMLDPERSNSASPRDLTGLLRAIWRDEAATPAACASMRRMLGLQVWPHRLASGFPYDDVRVSGKTGTLPTMRHEIGVVEYPDGGRYAVAVLTQAAAIAATQPQVDAAIGSVARAAVERLRAP
ncbi:Beta-lactamase regulatory protein BlaB [Baekduia alba]|uniref:serine hydrolase n=1 Tax=Baekduia alba TaxID=2997333 RepID=UPI002341D6AC|nr:serine hydrolase [Baekduia alba]WCB92243.1 Beta-lactamase regulatory protein BlaB [Baekduia alba]